MIRECSEILGDKTKNLPVPPSVVPSHHDIKQTRQGMDEPACAGPTHQHAGLETRWEEVWDMQAWKPGAREPRKDSNETRAQPIAISPIHVRKLAESAAAGSCAHTPVTKEQQ